MKIHILSDLHIEFGAFEVPETEADVVVFAGDIGEGLRGLEWIQSQNIDVPIIYVPGNHEFYRHEMALVKDIKASAHSNVHVLDRDVVVIDGVRFLGCTLWTDFQLFGDADKLSFMQHAKNAMADFRLITHDDETFTPQDSIELHEQDRDWLQTMLLEPFEGTSVVITHHFPSAKSIHPRYAQDKLTPAFGSNLESMMGEDRVALWCHGHTHEAFDYSTNGTRVVCNPRGYVGYEAGEYFKPDLLLTV